MSTSTQPTAALPGESRPGRAEPAIWPVRLPERTPAEPQRAPAEPTPERAPAEKPPVKEPVPA